MWFLTRIPSVLLILLFLPGTITAQWSHSPPASEGLPVSTWNIDHPDIQTSSRAKHPSAYWTNIGLGVGTAGLSAIGGLSYQSKANLFSLRGSTTGMIFEDNFWDLALLYGWVASDNLFYTSVSTGLGLVGGNRSKGGIFSSEHDEKIPATIALPLQAQFYVRPTGIFGIGLYGFGSLNAEQSFAGIALSLQIGNF